MEAIYKKYVEEKLDEKGILQNIIFKIPEDFNFGYDCVRALAGKCPDKPAMYWLSKNKEEKIFTFLDIEKYSNKTANYFESLGIKRGDRVMLILKRHYQFWYSIVALHKMGAVVIPATNQLTQKDFIYRFNKAGVKAVICTADGDVASQCELALPESKTVTIKSIVNGKKDGWESFDEKIESFSDQYVCKERNVKSDTMIMYFTSGTTGYPKIVAQDYTYALGHLVTARYWQNVDPNGIHFTISDTGWGKAVWGKLYGQWLCESAVFTYDFDKFDSADMLSVMQKYAITTFCAPPTMYRFFIKENLSKYNLSSLKHTCIAGEALNPEVFKQFYEATGLKPMEGFGQTETTLAIANLIGTQPKPGSMGKPNPQYDVALLASDGKNAKTGEVGEICIRTDRWIAPGMFKGYYEDSEKTKEAWYDNHYHTGDMAWFDEDGYYWYVGRTDDLIKSSGYRIGPFEIESVIIEHPSVLECAVTGVPDPVRGQLVKATIVLAKGFTASEDLKKEIQDYVKNLTAPYKYPRVIEFVDELPKTISGKIRRKVLRKEED